jgi:hypothetical protein
MFKIALRVAALVLCAIIGLWAVGHGFTLAASVQVFTHEEMLQYLVEVSISIAGGICVLSVAAEQLNCWRTHHKDGGMI